MKKIKAIDVPPRKVKTVYPEPFASKMNGRVKRQLGEYFGITQYGVNLTIIEPNGQSSLMHQHTLQEEFIYVLEGHPTLVTEEGEIELSPHECVGFIPGKGAHMLVNKTSEKAVYLEVGDRNSKDEATYPQDDLVARMVEGKWKFQTKDGKDY